MDAERRRVVRRRGWVILLVLWVGALVALFVLGPAVMVGYAFGVLSVVTASAMGLLDET